MSKQCSLKESFIEKQLDKYQSNWRGGEDITAETKQKIRDYVIEKLPEDLKEDVTCITDYSIWNMAQKIRAREGLPLPKKTNKGKVSKCESSKGGSKVGKSKPEKSSCKASKAPKTESLSCNSQQNNDIEPEPEQDDEGFPLTIIEAIRGLNIYFSIEAIKQAVATIEREKVT
jgi:hypothetical protein